MKKITVFVADDDEMNLDLLEGILGDTYQVKCFLNPIECVNAFELDPADIVLLDVSMPEQSGLETCRQIKALEGKCPVLFISGKVAEEDRLAGYDAGGYDYIAKPFNGNELLAKMAHIVKQLQQSAEVVEEKEGITAAFMDAITGQGEQGLVLQFASNVFSVTNYLDLAKTIVETCGEFGIKVSMLIEGKQNCVYWSSDGDCSPMESNVLSLLRKTQRIYEFNGRFQFNEKNISLLVKNMPQDEAIAGRLRDHLLLSLRMASSCVDSIDAANSNIQLIKQIKETSDELLSAEKSVRKSVFASLTMLTEQITRIEDEIQYFALSHEQEDQLITSLHTALHVTSESSDQTAAVCDQLNALVVKLNDSL
ncbi:MAG: response regulator [Psychromonas sp.]|nr:response regulator [Alteromonadales bacterium]MCP5078251.1 response regulator [Psychromonas sp.]